jgi:tetratricopeptide (TPR) repeat protein
MMTRFKRNIGWRHLLILSGLVGISLLAIGLVARANLNRALIACNKFSHGLPIACSLKVSSQDVRASYHLGLNAWRAGALPQAIEYLTEHLAKDPNDINAGLFLGLAYRQSGDEAKALAIWHQTGAFQYFVGRGWQYGSIDDLQTAIAAGEANPATFFKLGDVLWDVGQLQEAGKAYKEGLALDTSNTPQSLLAKGRLLELSKDWLQSIDVYQGIVETWPDSPEPYLRIGNIYQNELSDRNEALSWYTRCVQQTRVLPCYLAAGKVNLEDENYEAALYWGTLAQSVYPNDSAPLLFIAAAWDYQGNLHEAEIAYQRAADLDPDNFWIPYYQGYLEVKYANLDKAEEFFLRSAKLGSTV